MIFSFIYKNINFIVFQLNNKSTYFHKESNGMNKMIHFGNLGNFTFCFGEFSY